MKTPRLSRRWQRQYRKLFERQCTLLRQCRESSGHDEVHDLRVALRRLRLMLRVTGPLANSKAAEDFLRWSHRLLKATSRLRDCDAVLEWLARRRDATLARERLDRQRQRLWQVARAGIQPLPPKIRRRLSGMQLNHRQKNRLEERFRTHFRRLEETINGHLSDFQRLDADRQHTFRRKLRRLRYLREIELSRRQQGRDPWLKVVLRLQTAMGESQNLTIASQLLRRAPRASMPSSLREALAHQRTAWEKEISRSSRRLRQITGSDGSRRARDNEKFLCHQVPAR